MKNLHKFTFLFMFILLFSSNIFSQTIIGIDGTTGTYSSFNDLMANIESETGDLRYSVSGEFNEQIHLISTTANSVTFIGDGTANIGPDNFSGGNYVLKIDGSRYSFENIKFQNSSTDTGIGTVIVLGDNCEDNTFTSCIFNGRNDLLVENQSNNIFSVITSSSTDGSLNTKFINDTINGGSYGYYLNYSSGSNLGMQITGCEINDFTSTGIYFNNASEFIIENNSINDKNGITNTTTGININNADINFRINANKIDLTSLTEKTGIKLSNSTSPTSSYVISNNMISSRNAVSAIVTGIWLEDCSDITTIYNSIYITDGNDQSSAFKIYDSATQTSFNNVLFNNLLINNSSAGYSMILQDISNLGMFDNNDYFTSGVNLINSSGTDFPTILTWQLFDTQMPIDTHSFSALPNFISNSDLHITESTLSYVEGRAIADALITTDIDGEQRDDNGDSFTDVGADEGMFTLLWTGNILDMITWKDVMVIEGQVNIYSEEGGTKSGSLFIEPGTVLKFKTGAKLIGDGSIDAIGTKESPILFTSENNTNTWNGISHFSAELPTCNYEFCKFENSTNDYGGVFDILNGNNSITIKHCEFFNNSGTNGGAIYTDSSSPTIDANLFFNNSATAGGGAIYSTIQVPILKNNIFYTNSSATTGGAIKFYNITGAPMIMNNTFHLNSSTSFGKSIYLEDTDIQIYNSIFWSDEDGYQVYSNNTSLSSITNCIVKGGFTTGINLLTYTEILQNNPLFTDINNMNFSVQANSVAVDGGAYITGQDMEFDYAGNSRIFNYGIVDIGAYELQAPRLFADAGEDMSDCYSEQYLPDMYSVEPYHFEWTILNNSEAFLNEQSEGMYSVKNLPPSTPVEIMLSVSNGFITETDTLFITNTQPYVNAGEDILLINSDINNNSFPDTAFNANSDMPASGLYGSWTMISSTAMPAPTIVDTQLNNSSVTGINYGISNFMWTITDEGSCSNSDTVLIVAGHSYTSIPDGTFDWNTPSDWAEGALPGAADSVTIYGVNGNVTSPGAVCDRLYVGNGATLNILGTAKATSSLSCRTLTVEENIKKFKGITGSANMYIKDFATLNIGSEYISKARSTAGSGLFIGSGGTVFIRPNAEKTGSKGTAGLNIGSGGFIFIRPNAEKTGSKGTAGLNVGSGGFVFIRPNAEKNNTQKNNLIGDIVVGAGGSLNLEQTITGTSGGYLELGKNRLIYISPSTAKLAGGNFGIYGGTVFIRPNAEKSTKGFGNSGIYCGAGGTIFIRPNAEKAQSNSTLIAPNITIDGGQILVGNNVKGKAVTGSLQFNQIFIRPNAEKAFATDTALIVYPSGEFILSDESNFEMPKISVGSGEAVSFLEGSIINTQNSTNNTAINLKKGASLIDMNPSSTYNIVTEHTFLAGKRYLFSPSTETIDAWDLGSDYIMGQWDELSASWLPIIADNVTPGKGYFLSYNSTDVFRDLFGKSNTGEFNTPVTLTDIGNFQFEGWNLVGNPYPSAIDLEKIDLPVDFYNTFYTFDPIKKQYMLYQQGGVSLNGASQFVKPNTAFFVKTDANSIFNINNDARVHYFNTAKNTNETNNILKLEVSGAVFSDETAILFNNNATDNFDKEYDAAKIFNNEVTKPILYTKISGEDAPIAINTLEYQLNSETIPLYFETPTIGNYSINVSELNFDTNVTVFLKDLKNGNLQDLRSNPTYNFIYTNGDDANRFEIIFDGFVGIENIANENNINIFSNKNTIFINNKFDNSKVEVYDLNGKLLLQKDIFNAGLTNININLAQTIYLVKVITKEETVCKKVIITK